jgi:hypothetical protein
LRGLKAKRQNASERVHSGRISPGNQMNFELATEDPKRLGAFRLVPSVVGRPDVAA